MPGRGIFVTGTDTDVGKTWVSLALMHHIQKCGKRVLGMKPVSAGCEITEQGLRNEDALALIRQSSITMDYSAVNPYAFEPPIAPHIAAELAGEEIQLDRIVSAYDAMAEQADWVIVEGAGGWLVPLSNEVSLSDVPVRLGLPVVMVVGLRLGCINHALLTEASALQSGCRLLGWVGSAVDPDYLCAEAMRETLRTRLSAPCLGVLEYQQSDALLVDDCELDVSFCLN